MDKLVAKSDLFGKQEFSTHFIAQEGTIDRIEHDFLTWYYHRLNSKVPKAKIEGKEGYSDAIEMLQEKRDKDPLFNDSCAFMDGESLPLSKRSHS